MITIMIEWVCMWGVGTEGMSLDKSLLILKSSFRSKSELSQTSNPIGQYVIHN